MKVRELLKGKGRKSPKTQEEESPKKKVREFLYLDSDFLESFLAQTEGGLEVNLQSEIGTQQTHTKGNRTRSGTVEGSAETAGLFGLFVKAQSKALITVTNAPMSIANTKTGREIVTKQLHDFMFNIFYDRVDPEKLEADHEKMELGKKLETDREKMKPGKYIKHTAAFKYIDLERIGSLFDENNHQIFRDYDVKPDPSISFPFDYLKRVHRILDYAKTMIPFGVFLYSDGLLIVLKEEYLREKRQQLGFKFDGEMTVVGKANKIVPEQNDDSLKVISALNRIQRATINMLNELGFINKDEVLIVTPIAVYYENDY